MSLADHNREGVGLAQAIRQRVQAEDEIRKARTLHTENEEVRKANQPDNGPRSAEFAAALEQYSALLGSPGSVSYGDVAQRQASIEAKQQALANHDSASLGELHATDQRLADMGSAAAQTPNPQGKEKLPPHTFTGPSDGPSEVVHKVRQILGMETGE